MMNKNTLLISDKNRELFEDLSEKMEIQIKCADNSFWKSELKDKKIVVYTVESDEDEAFFSLELLRLRLQIDGYKPIKSGYSIWDETPYFQGLLNALDEALQGFVLYQSFLKMGYSAELYRKGRYHLNEQQMEEMLSDSKAGFKEYFYHYLYLIIPGIFSEEERKRLKSKFHNLKEGRYKAFFEHVKMVLDNWSNYNTTDAEPFIMMIFQAITQAKYTWIGYGEKTDFPKNGFFVDQIFTIKTEKLE